MFDSVSLPEGEEAAAAAGPAHWLRMVAKNRVAFEECALVTVPESDDLGPEFFLFLYAKQNPYQATFLKLHQQDVVLPSLGDVAGTGQMWEAVGDHFMNRFVYEPFDYVTELEVPAAPDGSNLRVVQCVQHFELKCLVSDMPPEPFSTFVAGLPEPTAPSKKREKTTVKTTQAKATYLLAEYPWLEEYLNVAGEKAKANNKGSNEEPAEPTEDPDLEEDDEEALDAAWEALQVKRQSWDLGTLATDDFQLQVRGGRWT